MAKPNYSFEKRQRELAKKKKKEEKRLKKSLVNEDSSQTGDITDPVEGIPSTSGDPE